MKKIILLLLLTTFSFVSQAQTNELAMQPKLSIEKSKTGLNLIQVGLPVQFPVYDNSSSFGRCMNEQIKGCMAMSGCAIACRSSLALSYGCLGGFALKCAFSKVQIIEPIKKEIPKTLNPL